MKEEKKYFTAADYSARRARLATFMREHKIDALLIEDTEGRRDEALRYLTGQANDCLLVISSTGESILIAWDVNMAKQYAHVEHIVAYENFERSATKAFDAALQQLGIRRGTIELPTQTPYLKYFQYSEQIPQHKFLCQFNGAVTFVEEMRAIKDSKEIELYRYATGLTSNLIDEVEKAVRAREFTTELDVALFLERRARELQCEGMGFETLVAGPTRSFGIHAFPNFSDGPFATAGLSILDFGLKFQGYVTDITLTVYDKNNARAPHKAEEMLALVEEAHDTAISMCAPRASIREIALKVDQIFANKGYRMPHSLGHGLGLQAHEAPRVSSRCDAKSMLHTGHIITIEPGLYDEEVGGTRLEDDVLITETGHEVLTRSRIIRL